MKFIRLILLVIGIGLTACSQVNSSHFSWETTPIVAHIDTIQGELLTVCSLDKLKDTLHLPLSQLVEELQIVKLDRREEAMVGTGDIQISEEHILIGGWNTPCKLFRKDGTFLCKVGDVGQAPGEYQTINDIEIDEKQERIYILPHQAKSIYVYTLNGTFEKEIPLNLKHPQFFVPKGTFQVDKITGLITIVTLPFHYLPNILWVQDMEGKIIHEVPSGHMKLKPNYSNEVMNSKATEKFSFHISPFFELRKDSLYQWDEQKKKLIPRFTLDYGEAAISLHNYFELPLYYFGNVADTKQMTKDSFISDHEQYFIVDKETLKGGYCHIYNDYLCDEPVDWFVGNNGYFIENVAPEILSERIGTFLKKHPQLEEDRKQKLLTLKESIHENDNHYVIYGKHRTRK